jgi:hypothetical protein
MRYDSSKVFPAGIGELHGEKTGIPENNFPALLILLHGSTACRMQDKKHQKRNVANNSGKTSVESLCSTRGS